MIPAKNRKLHRNQAGLVSIIVTMVIMVVLSLITVAYARIARREQRQSLDRQLAAQAFYAAETGINDAIELYDAGSKTDCAPDPLIANPVLEEGVEYTCLLIEPDLKELIYNVGTETTTNLSFNVLSANNPADTVVDELRFRWQETPHNPSDAWQHVCGTTFGNFPAAANWPANCDAGVLRVDIVPLASFDRDAMAANARTYFLIPRNDFGGSISYASTTGSLAEGRCAAGNPERMCYVTVQDLGVTGARAYHVRISSIYRNSNVLIEAENAAGETLRLSGAQKLIDVTGKANDILKRLEARVPIEEGSNFFAHDAITSGTDLCKILSIAPGNAQIVLPSGYGGAAPVSCGIPL